MDCEMCQISTENKCPLCGNSNHCGVNDIGGCWCGKIDIPMELIEQLPEQGKACICLECVKVSLAASGGQVSFCPDGV